jgi:hypothetical protein
MTARGAGFAVAGESCRVLGADVLWRASDGGIYFYAGWWVESFQGGVRDAASEMCCAGDAVRRLRAVDYLRSYIWQSYLLIRLTAHGQDGARFTRNGKYIHAQN